MKIAVLAVLLAAGIGANAQQKPSLKELLYGGKLKLDSNSVVRRDDDLSDKIDTSTRKPVPVAASKAYAPQKDVAQSNPPSVSTSAATTNAEATDAASAPATEAATPKAAAPRSNTKIWKEYTDSLLSSLKTEVLTNKKIKKDSYFVLVEYEFAESGALNILNVTSSPENALLQSEIKSRLDNNPPLLQPILNSSGKVQKMKRKQSFTVVKD